MTKSSPSIPGGRQNVVPGTNRAALRSPAIILKMVFRDAFDRAPGQMVVPDPDGWLEKKYVDVGVEAIADIVEHGV